MFEHIKNNLFTLHGVLTSLLHVLIVVGMLSSWVFVRVEVLGDDVSLSLPTPAAIKGRLK